MSDRPPIRSSSVCFFFFLYLFRSTRRASVLVCDTRQWRRRRRRQRECVYALLLLLVLLLFDIGIRFIWYDYVNVAMRCITVVCGERNLFRYTRQTMTLYGFHTNGHVRARMCVEFCMMSKSESVNACMGIGFWWQLGGRTGHCRQYICVCV